MCLCADCDVTQRAEGKQADSGDGAGVAETEIRQREGRRHGDDAAAAP